MVRIIKLGNIPPEQEKYKKCKNCETEFAYKKSDIKFDLDYEQYVVCPLCNRMILVSIFDKKVKK